jgi:hypothetical protein
VIIMTDETKGAAQSAAPGTSFASYQQAQSAKIRDLNDRFRWGLEGGSIVVTSGVHALGFVRVLGLIEEVKTYGDFTADNDPHGEHDFGSFELFNQTFFWKIDYYDKSCEFGSEDPSDPVQTTRVLTLMLASEY